MISTRKYKNIKVDQNNNKPIKKSIKINSDSFLKQNKQKPEVTKENNIIAEDIYPVKNI